MPVAFRGTVCVPAVSVTLTAAERDPVAVGVKVTLIVQPPLGAMALPQVLL